MTFYNIQHKYSKSDLIIDGISKKKMLTKGGEVMNIDDEAMRR